MNPCAECGEPGDHQHHVVPKSLGGTYTVWLCERHHGIVHERGGMVGHRALTKAALARRRADGLTFGPIAPYGFVAVKGHLIPEPAEQATMAMGRRWRGLGMSLRAICALLAEHERFSRSGRPFAPSAIATWCKADTPPVNAGPQ